MHSQRKLRAKDPGGLLNVRSGPGRDYPVIAAIADGSMVGVVAPMNTSTRMREPQTTYRDGYTWVLTDVDNGSQRYRGWVVFDYLK